MVYFPDNVWCTEMPCPPYVEQAIKKEQKPICAVLGCADSRVPAEILFDVVSDHNTAPKPEALLGAGLCRITCASRYHVLW